jgi:hypothetical protein
MNDVITAIEATLWVFMALSVVALAVAVGFLIREIWGSLCHNLKDSGMLRHW